MVIDLRIHGNRIEPCSARVSFVEAGTRDRQVEHLETLRSERAREAPVAANRILARDPPLFVRDRSQGDIGRRVKQAMVRLDAIARRKNIRQVCAHLSRDDDRAAGADLRPGLSREFAVGASADRKQYEVRFVPGARGVQNRQPRWAFNCNLVYLRRTDAGEDANAVASQFFLDEAAKRWVDGRQHRVRSAKKRDFEPALGESSAISSPM